MMNIENYQQEQIKEQNKEEKKKIRKKKANRALLKSVALCALWMVVGVIVYALNFTNNIIGYIWLGVEILFSCMFWVSLVRWIIAYWDTPRAYWPN